MGRSPMPNSSSDVAELAAIELTLIAGFFDAVSLDMPERVIVTSELTGQGLHRHHTLAPPLINDKYITGYSPQNLT